MAAVGRIELRVAESGTHHVGIVERRLHRLAQLEIRKRPLFGVQHEVRKTEGRREHRLHARIAFEPGVRFDRQEIRELVLSREHSLDARVGVRHRNETQLVEQRLALAGISACWLLARAVSVEPDHLYVLIGLALLEHVRPGADELGERVGDRVLRHDHREAGRKREVREQRRVRPVERDDYGVRTFRFEALDLLRDGLAARRHLHPALERRDDIVGRHFLPVVKLDALAQRDGVDEPVLRDRRHALREHGRHVPVGVEGVQRLVDMLHDRAHQIGGRRHGVERLRLADHREVRRSALRRRGKRGAARKGYRRRYGQRQNRAAGTKSRVTEMHAADGSAKHDSSLRGMAKPEGGLAR